MPHNVRGTAIVSQTHPCGYVVCAIIVDIAACSFDARDVNGRERCDWHRAPRSNHPSTRKANVAKNQNTFEKRRREMEKKMKAEEKRKRRDKKKDEASRPGAPVPPHIIEREMED
jgi:hypothetical protein